MSEIGMVIHIMSSSLFRRPASRILTHGGYESTLMGDYSGVGRLFSSCLIHSRMLPSATRRRSLAVSYRTVTPPVGKADAILSLHTLGVVPLKTAFCKRNLLD